MGFNLGWFNISFKFLSFSISDSNGILNHEDILPKNYLFTYNRKKNSTSSNQKKFFLQYRNTPLFVPATILKNFLFF
jgi:hypothetical protein